MILHRFLLLLGFLQFTPSLAQVHDNRIWLKPNTDIKLNLNTETAQVFCFQKPDFSTWLSNCLKDFNVSLQVAVFWSSWNPLWLSIDVYEGFSQSPMIAHELTCSSLEKVASDSTSFDLLSFLLTPHSSPVSRKSLTTDGLNWTSPSYPPSCFAVCAKTSISGPPPTLSVKTYPTFNQRHVIFTLIGVVLLLAAKLLSSNMAFYYFSGSGFVVLGTFLLVLIMFIRLLPLRRSSAILQTAVVLLGGTFSLILVALDYVRASLLQLITNNIELTFIYAVSVTGLSLVFFYWLHLPEKLVSNYPRTKIIMKYFLQILGASLIVASVQLPFTEEEIFFLFVSFIPSSLSSTLIMPTTFVHMAKNFPPKILWVVLVFMVVSCVNLIDCVVARLSTSQTPKVDRDFPVKKDRVDYHDHIPGSPWASSSPYHYPQGFTPMPTHSRLSMSRGRSLNPDADYPNGDSVFSPSPRPSMKYNEDILTDDESD